MVEMHETEEFALSSKVFLLAEECDKQKSLEDFNGYYRATGPCGDTVEIWLKIQNDIIDDASCRVSGCIPSKACTMAAVILVKGKKLDVASTITAKAILDYIQELPEEAEHCALLAAETLEHALKDYLTSRNRR